MFVSVEPLLETRKHGQIVRAFCLVGVARLELAALRSRTVRATKLRYTPINIHAALASSVACLGARRACPLGLAFFTADLELFVSFGDFTCFVYALIANQTALHPDNIYAQSIFDCFCNIHQFRYFCNKNKSIISKNIICAVIFLLRHKKSIAKQSFVIYNNSRDGAWCSGSTWASDSHCVGSIPIAPANANTLTCGGVSFILLPLMLASNGQKNKRNTHAVCLR